MLHRRVSVVLSAAVAAGTGLFSVAAAGESSRTGVLGYTGAWVCEHHEGCLHGKLERAAIVAAIDLAWDEATGRDLRHYPPDRLVDYRHMKLEMRFEDLNHKAFSATETLSFEPIGEPTAALTLHAVGLDIQRVAMNGRSVEHYHDGETLTVHFDPPLTLGQAHELVVDYICRRPVQGMFFTPARPEAPDYTAEVHTQGQTESNRHWFVAHDFPNDMMTTELLVDVPAGYQVSSNGRLVSHEVDGDRERWHWLQDKPHVSYLVTLTIGKFDVVPLEHDRVPMQVWAPPGTGHLVKQTYGNTGAMIDLFEKRFGVAYPWARYDQLIVKNFGAGGMENTAATNMYPSAILDDRALLDRDLDGLIAHELAHQWAGNLLTCKSWEHIWLNEGWATFGEALWFEHRDGEVGYLDRMRRSFNVARRDRTTNDLPMVSPIYRDAFDTFRRAASPYPKGASILHMLRMKLGEEIFWQGTHLYFNRHQHQSVETSDFRYALEEVSGRGLEWFFDQWCYRPGSPRLKVRTRYEPRAGELQIDVEQTQQIDWRTPAFRFALPVWVRIGEDWTVYEVDVREQTVSFRRELPGMPTVVAIDPELHVLKLMEEDKAMTLWRGQLEHGPNIIAQHDAIAALGRHDGIEQIERLEAIARDDAARYSLRNSAVDALASLASPEARKVLVALLNQGVAEARIRANLVRQLRDETELRDLFVMIAETDQSYATRVAAIEALARQAAHEHADVIAKLVHYPSQHEQVRTAALSALATLDDPRALDLAIQYGAYGELDRARAQAVRTIAEAAHHDHSRAVEFLLPLLHDPERRTVMAAGTALSRIGDERAKSAIQAMANVHRDDRLRQAATRWLSRMEETAENDDD